MSPVYLVACPARHLLPVGFIDATAGHPAFPEDAEDTHKILDDEVAASDEALMVFRCRRDGSWWVVVP